MYRRRWRKRRIFRRGRRGYRKKRKLALEKKWLDRVTGTLGAPIVGDDATYIQIPGPVSTGSWLGILQRVGESQRIGRKIVLTDILWNGAVEIPAKPQSATIYSAAVWDTVRLIVYQDKQCNGTIASLTDIFQTNTIKSYRNVENAPRFKILWDKQIPLRAQFQQANNAGSNLNAIGAVIKTFRFHWKGFMPVEYNGTAGTLAEVRSNNINAIWITENSDAQVGTTLHGTYRIRYYG